jgi:hypothetical protein
VVGVSDWFHPTFDYWGVLEPKTTWDRLGEWYYVQYYQERLSFHWAVWVSVAQLSALLAWIVTWRWRESWLYCDMSKR